MRVLVPLLLRALLFLDASRWVLSALAAATNEFTTTAASQNKQCLVVGGGPVGLAAAITLSRPPHSYKVTVLEQTEGATAVRSYNPARSYVYNVNPRGLDWFEFSAPKSAWSKLQQRGCAPPTAAGMGRFVSVAGNPKIPIPKQPKEVRISGVVALKNRTNYWIPRHEMVEMLLECCQEQNAEKTVIELMDGKEVDAVYPDNGGGGLKVHCKDESTYSASLVVAADGIDSAVRSCLADDNDESNKKTWLQSNAKAFRVKKYKSPSTGLKLKALQFPANFTLTNTDGSIIETEGSSFYAINSVNKGSRNSVSLGLLPFKNAKTIRPANTNIPYDHEIWSLQTGAEAKAWFQKSFPRLQWDDLVDDAEWERYVKARGTTFPDCQYSRGSAVSAPDGLSGVVMVGDACHAFPPDIGQGINAGLQDVVALDRSLRGQDIASGEDMQERPENLGAALTTYQTNRTPEHRALIRLARFGAPFQYKQPWKRHRIGKFFWTLNVAFRLLLNKISFGLIPPAAIVQMAQNPGLSFRQIMRRADSTTIGLKVACLAYIFRLLAKKFLLV